MKRFYLNAKNIVQLTQILVAAITEKLFRQAAPRFVKSIDDVCIAPPEGAFRHQEPRRLSQRLNKYDPSFRALRLASGVQAHVDESAASALARTLLRSTRNFEATRPTKSSFSIQSNCATAPVTFSRTSDTWGILGRFLPRLATHRRTDATRSFAHLHGRSAHARRRQISPTPVALCPTRTNTRLVLADHERY